MHGTKQEYTRRVQVYDHEVNEKCYQVILEYFPGPETVIKWVNLLVKYQQELLVFTDCKGRLIGDSGVNLTVVDEDKDENETQLKI